MQQMTDIIPGLQGDLPSDHRKGSPYVGKYGVYMEPADSSY